MANDVAISRASLCRLAEASFAWRAECQACFPVVSEHCGIESLSLLLLRFQRVVARKGANEVVEHHAKASHTQTFQHHSKLER